MISQPLLFIVLVGLLRLLRFDYGFRAMNNLCTNKMCLINYEYHFNTLAVINNYSAVNPRQYSVQYNLLHSFVSTLLTRARVWHFQSVFLFSCVGFVHYSGVTIHLLTNISKSNTDIQNISMAALSLSLRLKSSTP